MTVRTLLDWVGETPLVELPRLSPKRGVRLFAKLEGQNPSGSVKDRIARSLVLDAQQRGLLEPGGTLVEASTGNTAIALGMVARQLGYGLRIVMPEGAVPTIADALRLLQVDVEWVTPRTGLLGAIERAQELAQQDGWHLVGQFDNPLNVDTHYRTTGKEIAEQLPNVDVVVAGIGTGGTLMGIGRRLREVNPRVRVVGVEPKLGERLQGLRSADEGWRPPLVDLDALDARFLVDAATALALARRVMAEEGILAGVSSGAALHAALRYAERIDEGNVVVVFSDGGWKYLPTRPWNAGPEESGQLDEVHWW